MKRKLTIFFGSLFILFMLVTNLTFLRFFLPQTYPHTWSSDQGKFWTVERAKGRDPFGSVLMAFENYKKETNQPNLVLHRCFYRKWWQVWNWYFFLTDRRWNYPYARRVENT
jgi:hypothetical protein